MTNAKLLLQYADISLLVASIAILFLMWRKRLMTTFTALSFYLFAVLALEAIQIPIMFFRRSLGIDVAHAYHVLFYGTQAVSVLETALMIAMIYGVFQAAMRPFEALQRMGKIVFMWVAGVSLLLATVSALGPRVFSGSGSSTAAVTTVIQRGQESTNILTLCLLVFVCFSIKQLGLTYRSRVFGLSLGLGLISTVELVVAAWFLTSGAHSVYSPIYLVNIVGYLIAFVVWGIYFTIPEPERKLLTLPTTSPFFHWNRIAEALGEQPGQVAISFTPSMFAPGEVRAMETINKYKLKREAESRALAAAQSSLQLDDIAAS